MQNDTNYEVLNDILDNEVTYFTDKNNPLDVYVEFNDYNDSQFFCPISSRHFENFIYTKYDEMNPGVALPKITSAIKKRKAAASYYHDNPVEICNRLSGSISGGEIVYALGDNENSFICVTPDCCDICDLPDDIRFVKKPTDLPQVFPGGKGNLLELLRPYVNMDDDDFRLFVVFLIQLFSRSSNHYIAVISSAKGTGKTTLTKLISQLIDPSKSSVVITSNSTSDLKNVLANNYLVCFDNTATMSSAFSDILCASVTGVAESKRELFSDREQVVLDLHNAIVINGIDIVPHKADLMDRSILFELRKIPPEKRMTEFEFWKKFELDKPAILRGIFLALHRAMGKINEVMSPDLERMADANLEMLAIADALGIDSSTFHDLLENNRNKIESIYSTSNAFVDCVAEYVSINGSQNCLASALYDRVKASFHGQASLFPGSASIFSRKLEQEHDALQKAGITLIRRRDPSTGCAMIELHSPKFPAKSEKRGGRSQAKKTSSMMDSLLSEDDSTD